MMRTLNTKTFISVLVRATVLMNPVYRLHQIMATAPHSALLRYFQKDVSSLSASVSAICHLTAFHA